MNRSDVIVIGAGLAGLTAAIAAADQGYKVVLLAKGAGTLAFGGGTIDVLGSFGGRGIASPAQALDKLPETHPYTITGSEGVKEAIQSFKRLCAEAGYPLDGEPERNIWMPTTAGTLKPSCLLPKTMNPAGLEAVDCIHLVNFSGLKDCYPELIIKGLQAAPRYAAKEYRITKVETNLAPGRDITLLDIARWMNTPAGQESFVSQIRPHVMQGDCLLIPPVLGTEPCYDIWQQMQDRLGCRLLEMAAPPPGITGMRLRTLLLRMLKQKKVAIIEQANVRYADIQGNSCKSLTTKHFGREKKYAGDSIILAAGGFLGGGLVAEPLCVREPIFGLPVANTLTAEQGGTGLLEAGNVFQSGVHVDGRMRPIDMQGNVVLENVHLAGNILAGYDYCAEKSGNGVAVVTAYQAVQSIAGRQKQ